MVKYQAPTDTVGHTFSALSDRTRRTILQRLAQGDSTVSELARPFAISLPAVSKHLRVLEAAGLVVRERDGRVRRCHLVATPMLAAANWIGQYRAFWEERFDNLAEFLEADGDRSGKE